MKSIISDSNDCYICVFIYNTDTPGTEVHHCLHGSMRANADADGLTVKLCNRHHRRLHDLGEFDKSLQIIAQRAYIEKLMSEGMREEEARERFRSRYGKFYE